MATRERILDAAAHVMRTRGFAHTTTREVARAAEYSEATIYKHFQDKTELFLAVLHERLPSFQPLVAALGREPGQRTVRANLVEIVSSAIAFYHESFPMNASLFAEPELLAAHRTALGRRKAGPHRPVEAIARYLRSEQRAGRVDAAADCDAAAGLLVGACLQYAFLETFAQRALNATAARAYAVSVVDTLLAGLGA